MELRNVLKMLRKELGYSQSDLALALNISLVTVSRWETGKNTPNRSACVALMNLAAGHGVSRECLSELDSVLMPDNSKKDYLELNRVDINAANQVLNDAFSAIYVCDCESYELRYVNNTMSQMVGNGNPPVAGEKCYEYFMHRDSPCEFCSLKQLSSHKYTERRFKDPNGLGYFFMRGKLIDWKSRQCHIEYISRESGTQDDTEMFRKLAGRLPCAIGIMNVYLEGRLELTFLNDGFLSVIGCSEDCRTKFSGFEVINAIHPDDREKLINELLYASAEGRNASTEIRITKPGGSYSWFKLNGVVINRNYGKSTVYVSFSDINEVKKMQFSLEESRRAVALASTSGDIALWIYNTETDKISQSFQHKGALGYPVEIENGPEEIVAMGGVFKSDVHSFLDMYRKIRNGAMRSESTVRILNRDTERYEWLHIVLMRQPDLDPLNSTVLGFSMNVDLQKENEIRYEREFKLRQELIKDCVAYYRINLSNHMVEEMRSSFMNASKIKLPISMEQLFDKGLLDGVSDEYRDTVKKVLTPENMLRNYQSGKTTETLIYRREIPGKGLRWIRASVAKLKRVSSDDIVAFYSAVDIDDERKEQIVIRDIMEEEIERVTLIKPSTREIKVLMSKKSEGDMYAGSHFVSNDAFVNFITKDIVEEDRQNCADFISSETIDRRLSESSILQCIYRVKTEDGAVKRKKVRAFYADSTKADVIFVQRDITDLFEEEQRRKQRLQQAKDEADRANKAKSDFLSRMSHDMRTPLNAIISYSDHVLRDGISLEEKDAYLDDIHASGKYLLGIINDVLDMSKIDSNKMILHPEPYSFDDFFTTLSTVIAPLCEKKGVQFKVDRAGVSPKSAMLDKVHFNQIFVNLLSNAVKFTPSGGCVELSMRREELGDNYITAHFEVRDNGCGMSSEFLPHAFESFTQEYSGQSMHNEQGTGLGLSIVKKLVELMGGTISVESTLGKGSVFYVNIKMQELVTEQGSVNNNRGSGSLKGKKILLCEDNFTNSKIAVKLLEKAGCNVVWAKDGREGLDIFINEEAGTYDLILMDIRMPVMDGLSAAKAIRSSDKADSQSIPIVAMTANAFDEDIETSLKAGMNAHLTKPIEPEKLYATLEKFTLDSKD